MSSDGFGGLWLAVAFRIMLISKAVSSVKFFRTHHMDPRSRLVVDVVTAFRGALAEARLAMLIQSTDAMTTLT